VAGETPLRGARLFITARTVSACSLPHRLARVWRGKLTVPESRSPKNNVARRGDLFRSDSALDRWRGHPCWRPIFLGLCSAHGTRPPWRMRSNNPAALNLCIKADVAVGTRDNPRPESQFAGAAWASGACHRNAQKRPDNHCEEPEIEQKGAEHPKTLKHAQGMFGIEPDKHSSQTNHQEPSDRADNAQLQ
jgi:hypothetical protein